jgi:spermidine/putrescine transport system ATP-binding protein/putrescine transport system ATP-binding protein
LTFSVGEKALAAIRPEKIRLSSQRPTEGISVEGILDTAAYLGDRSHYYVRIEGVDTTVAVSTQNVDEDQVSGESRQGKVWLSWSNKSIVLLNAD